MALSYGERGESGELWKEPGRDRGKVKRDPDAEAETAAGCLGASFRCFDLGDYPLVVDAAALRELTALMGELRAGPSSSATPSAIRSIPITPSPTTRRCGPAYSRAAQGVASAFETVSAGAAPALRAPPAGALRLRSDDVPRHHAGLRRARSRRWRPCRRSVPAPVLRGACGAPREPRAAHLRQQGRFVTPRPSSAPSRRW